MASENGINVDQAQDKTTKRRRRVKATAEGQVKKPIRLVSSLGEGKLLDRFQNTLNDKESKKKSREKGEKDRKLAKEKRDREIAKFQEEINALLDDNPEPIKPNKDSKKIYVPKLTGTVKGKFEALESKKKEQEKSKVESERRKRQDRDLRDKKRIQFEIAKRKQKLKEMGENDDDDSQLSPQSVATRKKPGKLGTNFAEIAEKRREIERKKLEMERKMRISSEMRSARDLHCEEDEDEPTEKVNLPEKRTPGKLKTNLDEMFRSKEEEQRRKIEEERKRKLEEEKREFRMAKLASASLESDEEASSSQASSREKIRKTPNRLSSSFTKFDMLEKQRLEEERTNIRERRKALLEEEKKLFEESRKALDGDASDDDQVENPNENIQPISPGRLDASFTNFDVLSQQRLEEERKRILAEKQRLLEEENKNFKKEQQRLKQMKGETSSSKPGSSFCSSDSEMSSNESEHEKSYQKKKMTKRRKKPKHNLPNKLDYSKLKFDVLQRRRLENESLHLQQQRQNLVNEEAKLFEEAKRQQLQDVEQEEENIKTYTEGRPGRLDPTRTKFDILTQQKFEEERERIRNARMKIMEEENRIMEEERQRLVDENQTEEIQKTEKTTRKPKRLDKSFTEFDVLERKRKQQEEEDLFKEKAKKLQEERKAFKEAREHMDQTRDTDENVSDDNTSNTTLERPPNKLSNKFANFDVEERERLEMERLRAQEERIKSLEEEVKRFEEQKKIYHDSDDDVTSSTKELFRAHRDSPRPRKLAQSFTKFDVMERRRREEEREKMQREKARRLEEERALFEQRRIEELNNGSNSENGEEDSSRIKDESQGVKRMNVRSKIEAVMRAQEETERKRIEETKFCRMTVEQQEIFLARQKQINHLKEQLARAQQEEYSDEYEDESGETHEDGEYYYYYSDEEEEQEETDEEEEEENDGDQSNNDIDKGSEGDPETKSTTSDGTSSNGSGSYSGAPYFVQTLKNLVVTEGEPVRFDANINANPHPKVTWYFKNRAIRNCADYQYINKGTQYSLYMTESFADDSGEFMCKAVNDRGTATSKAILTVAEGDEE